MLDTSVNGHQVRELLQGSVLSDIDDHKMITSPVSRLPQSLFVLARNLAGALPALPLGPFELSIHTDGDVVGLRLDITDGSRGLDINPGSDVVLTLVTDASWIEPPSGTPPDPGLVVSIVSISSAPIPVVTPQPGIAANGLGLRISKASGPLLDAGLSIDAARGLPLRQSRDGRRGRGRRVRRCAGRDRRFGGAPRCRRGRQRRRSGRDEGRRRQRIAPDSEVQPGARGASPSRWERRRGLAAGRAG